MHLVVNGWFANEPATGSGQYIARLLTYLPQQESSLRTTLLLPHLPTGWEFERWPNVEIVVQEPLGLSRQWRKLWWEQVTVPLAAFRLGANVLWVPYWAAPIWQPCPVVVTVHDLIPCLLPAYRGGRLNRLYTALVSLTTRRATSVITVSHASARDIVEHLRVPNERVHVIYHGPNRDRHHHPGREELVAASARYGLPDRFFLYLGGFDIRKNLRATLQAYRRYIDCGGDRDIHMVIAGRLPDTDSDFAPDPRLIAVDLDLGELVHFCGLVEEVDKAALYELSTAFVFPSLYEGFGMMLLEAMSAGTPVITSGE